MTPWNPHDYAWEELHAFIERGFTPPEERPLPKPEPQPFRGHRHSSVIFDDASFRAYAPKYSKSLITTDRIVEGWLGPRDGLDEKLLFGWIAELQRKETRDGLG